MVLWMNLCKWLEVSCVFESYVGCQQTTFPYSLFWSLVHVKKKFHLRIKIKWLIVIWSLIDERTNVEMRYIVSSHAFGIFNSFGDVSLLCAVHLQIVSTADQLIHSNFSLREICSATWNCLSSNKGVRTLIGHLV